MKNEEYVENRGRDWIVFIVKLVGAIALLIWKPEWVWVSFPFVFYRFGRCNGTVIRV